jgi:hypothetical protein
MQLDKEDIETWTIQRFPKDIRKKAKRDALKNDMFLKGYIIKLIERGL